MTDIQDREPGTAQRPPLAPRASESSSLERRMLEAAAVAVAASGNDDVEDMHGNRGDGAPESRQYRVVRNSDGVRVESSDLAAGLLGGRDRLEGGEDDVGEEEEEEEEEEEGEDDATSACSVGSAPANRVGLAGAIEAALDEESEAESVPDQVRRSSGVSITSLRDVDGLPRRRRRRRDTLDLVRTVDDVVGCEGDVAIVAINAALFNDTFHGDSHDGRIDTGSEIMPMSGSYDEDEEEEMVVDLQLVASNVDLEAGYAWVREQLSRLHRNFGQDEDNASVPEEPSGPELPLRDTLTTLMAEREHRFDIARSLGLVRPRNPSLPPLAPVSAGTKRPRSANSNRQPPPAHVQPIEPLPVQWQQQSHVPKHSHGRGKSSVIPLSSYSRYKKKPRNE